jgi:aminoglycoside phosphotransferase
MSVDERLTGVLEPLGLGSEAIVRPFPATPTPWATAYSVTAGRTGLVARLVALDLCDEADVRAEFEVARLLGDHGLAPRVRYADPATGVLVMDHVDDAANVRTPAVWQVLTLARTLRRLHALPLDSLRLPEPPRLHVRKRDSASTAAAELIAGVPRLEVYSEAFERFDFLRAGLRRLGVPDRLCHNDLNRGNVLFDDSRAWLIDFDHSGAADPLFDLATAALSFGLDETLRAQFLEAYFDRPANASELARMELLTCLMMLRYGISAMSLVPAGMRDQLSTWTPEMVGDQPFDFAPLENETRGWLVFRLSLSFVHAGLARFAAEPAVRARETLGLLETSLAGAR